MIPLNPDKHTTKKKQEEFILSFFMLKIKIHYNNIPKQKKKVSKKDYCMQNPLVSSMAKMSLS